MKRLLTPLAVACCMAAVAPTLSAAPYSGLYVFGDSLSDQGNVSHIAGGALPPGEYTDGTTSGRFTNGKNYIDYLNDLPDLPEAAMKKHHRQV